VHDANLVGCCEPVQDVRRDLERLHDRQLLPPPNALAQRLALEPLHHEVGDARGRDACVRDADDIRVFEPTERPLFVAQAQSQVVTAAQTGK
jgi:hypothetical protein